MLKDVELAKSVNVISHPEQKDKVQDIYSEMIEPTHKKLKEISNEYPKYYKLGMVKLNRKLIKPSIMTRTYNVTIKGVCNQLISSFEKYTRGDIVKIKDNKILNLISNDDSLGLISKINKGEAVINDLDLDLEEETNLFYNEDNSESLPKTKLLNEILYKVPSFDEKESLFLNYGEVFKLAQVIHESLFIKYPALKQLFEYFVSVCIAFTKLDIPIL
jgi:DNA-directed RNA polymerase